ncbi:MAG TPA: (2Fe-2S)-binding protein [Candidatus Izemoplasmatales bacterium]|nr:(2Fe-2S)-binding protein [Candidatus Izemoplasmatales bacterium]
MNKKGIIVCRCEDVSMADIHAALQMGYRDFESLKRILRVGMGPCQGQTCAHLIKREIAKYNKVHPETVKIHKTRPLVSGVVLKDIAEGEDDE